MKPLPVHLVLLGVLGATLAGACDTELALILTGKRCRVGDEPACLEGFACIEGFCRVPQQVLPEPEDGGVGGGSASGSDSGEGGSDATSVGGTSALGEAGAQGGTSPILDVPDASIFLDGGPDGCVPLDLYRDRDGDGVGDTSQHAWGCIREGWVEAFGDCRDDLPDVRPNQTNTFSMGYPDPGKPGGISFDYDCVAGEQADTNNSPNGAAPPCQGLLGLGLACEGAGYQQTARGNAGGVNDLCGSDIVVTCISVDLLCVPNEVAVQQRFKCR